MSHIVLDCIVERAHNIMTIGRVDDNQLPGSISSDEPHGNRRLFVFGWRDGEPGVWEAEGGIDVTTVQLRDITTLGLTKLSDLSQPYEFTIHRAGKGPRHLRLTLVS